MADETLSAVFMRSLLAGGMAGCMVDLALFPLDSIKTRLQAYHKGKPVLFVNPYAGLLSTMVASFPCAATFWATYCTMKWILHISGIPLHPALMHIASATCGSITTSFVRAPFEVVKQQMQLGLHNTTRLAVSGIMQKKGPAGFFAGVGSLIMREIPFDVSQFLIYEWLKFADYGGGELSLLLTLRNGAIAGGCAAFLTTPIDVVKTRLMTQSKDIYKGVWQSLSLIFKTEGLAGLWSGWKVRVLYTTVGGMLFFGTFETASKFLG